MKELGRRVCRIWATHAVKWSAMDGQWRLRNWIPSKVLTRTFRYQPHFFQFFIRNFWLNSVKSTYACVPLPGPRTFHFFQFFIRLLIEFRQKYLRVRSAPCHWWMTGASKWFAMDGQYSCEELKKLDILTKNQQEPPVIGGALIRWGTCRPDNPEWEITEIESTI